MDKPSSSKKAGKSKKKKERGKKEKKEEVEQAFKNAVVLSVPQAIIILDEAERLRKASISANSARNLLPEDEKQQEQILCILKALREQCVEEGGANWEIDDGIRFVHRVKVVYQHDPRGYLLFLHLLEKFSIKERTLKFVVESVEILFQNSPDLLEEFNFLLPDSVKGVPTRPPVTDHIRVSMDDIVALDGIMKSVLPKEEYEKMLKVKDDKNNKRISEDTALGIMREIFLGNEILKAALGSMAAKAVRGPLP